MTAVGNEYHGIVVKESVKDHTILDRMQVLGQKTGRQWTLLKVRVGPKKITQVIRLIQTNLLSENGVPYYAHFYRNDELIVVFPERVFHVSPDRNSWREVVSCGESLGTPKAELDFKPCIFKDETY